jgi:hypothetical protein
MKTWFPENGVFLYQLNKYHLLKGKPFTMKFTVGKYTCYVKSRDNWYLFLHNAWEEYEVCSLFDDTLSNSVYRFCGTQLFDKSE